MESTISIETFCSFALPKDIKADCLFMFILCHIYNIIYNYPANAISLELGTDCKGMWCYDIFLVAIYAPRTAIISVIMFTVKNIFYDIPVECLYSIEIFFLCFLKSKHIINSLIFFDIEVYLEPCSYHLFLYNYLSAIVEYRTFVCYNINGATPFGRRLAFVTGVYSLCLHR